MLDDYRYLSTGASFSSLGQSFAMGDYIVGLKSKKSVKQYTEILYTNTELMNVLDVKSFSKSSGSTSAVLLRRKIVQITASKDNYFSIFHVKMHRLSQYSKSTA